MKHKQDFHIVIERDEDGWLVGSVPGLPGCHTQARTMDLLLKRIREAIELCRDVQGVSSSPNEFVGVQRIAV